MDSSDTRENRSLSRKDFLKVSLFPVVLLLAGKVIDTVRKAEEGLKAIQARSMPNEALSFEGFEQDLLEEDELELIYRKHIEPLVDEFDGEPILSREGFLLIMQGVHPFIRVHYNQLDEVERPSYADFTDNFVSQACEVSNDMGLRPEIFLSTSMISGQNILYGGGQQAEVKIYRAQVIGNVIQETLGLEFAKRIQRELANPDSYIFTEQGSSQLQSLLDLLNLGIDLEEDVRPMTGFEAFRFMNPTIGSMDVELDLYARSYAFISSNFPAVSERYFSGYPEVVSTMERLNIRKSQLEEARGELEDSVDELLKKHPHIVDDFFAPETAEIAFKQIGINENGPDNYSYSMDSYFGTLWDWQQRASASNRDERREFVVNETANYFSDLYQKDSHQARKSLIADQIFNKKLVSLLAERADSLPTFALRRSLRHFESCASEFREERLKSYKVLSELEYNSSFQIALSVATTRFILQDVLVEFPRLTRGDRDSIYWLMYLTGMIRESSPLTLMSSSFMRPDIDPPYANKSFLKLFRRYLDAYSEMNVIRDGDPPNFLEFALAEYRLTRMDIGNNPGAYGLNSVQVREIREQMAKLTDGVFSGWMRVAGRVFSVITS